jgi:hypothetical protein
MFAPLTINRGAERKLVDQPSLEARTEADMLVAYDKALLILVAYREARGDGRDAMRAVAHVIANRVKANKSSWVAEICKPKQFSSMTICGDSQTVVWPAEIDVVNLYALMTNVYNGTDPDNTNGALFYANEPEVGPGWYRANIIEGTEHPVTATVGQQTFRK